MTLSDVEIDRSLNALTTTLNDQRAQELDLERIEEITTGSLGRERKIEARAAGPTRATLHRAGDGREIAVLERTPEGRWQTERVREAHGSHAAVPS